MFGTLFWYSQSDMSAARGRIDANLHYRALEPHTGLKKWTHLTTVGQMVLVYNAETGRADIVDVFGDNYKSYRLRGIAGGFEQRAGASNGGLLLVDADASAAVAGDVWLERGDESVEPYYVLAPPQKPLSEVSPHRLMLATELTRFEPFAG